MRLHIWNLLLVAKIAITKFMMRERSAENKIFRDVIGSTSCTVLILLIRVLQKPCLYREVLAFFFLACTLLSHILKSQRKDN